MRYYIFITPEGYTYQLNSCATQPDVENCQVVGFGKGDGVSEALADFLTDNPWLLDTKFSEVIAYELEAEEMVGKYYIQEGAR